MDEVLLFRKPIGDATNLMVSNLLPDTTAADIECLFAPFGLVYEVQLPTCDEKSQSGTVALRYYLYIVSLFSCP
jgi:hypothetical protein